MASRMRRMVARKLGSAAACAASRMAVSAALVQGARLTAWELMHDEIDVTVITDSMAGHFMQQGAVDCVVVGSDRIAGAVEEILLEFPEVVSTARRTGRAAGAHQRKDDEPCIVDPNRDAKDFT